MKTHLCLLLLAFGSLLHAQEKRVKNQEKVIENLESERSREVKSIENNKNHIKNLETEVHDYDSELEALNTGIAKIRSERLAMTEKEDIIHSEQRLADIDVEVPDASMLLNSEQNELVRLRAEHEKIKLWAKS